MKKDVKHIKLSHSKMKKQAREFLLTVVNLPALDVASMTDDKVGVIIAEWCTENSYDIINNGERIVLFS